MGSPGAAVTCVFSEPVLVFPAVPGSDGLATGTPGARLLFRLPARQFLPEGKCLGLKQATEDAFPHKDRYLRRQ